MNTSSNGGGRRISSAAGQNARRQQSDTGQNLLFPPDKAGILPDINQNSSKHSKSKSRPGSAKVSVKDIQGTPKGSIMQKSLKSF